MTLLTGQRVLVKLRGREETGTVLLVRHDGKEVSVVMDRHRVNEVFVVVSTDRVRLKKR